MGELKARGGDGRSMYRLYYGEPDQQDDLAVGLCVLLKRTFPNSFSTTEAQNADIRSARDLFMGWLKEYGMTSGS
ncbi:hypothetical protein [Mycobacterium sp. SA01]|uniref:hypothetical protein n=1 Tax=Mycobacterium sp. SA01 TaxID=3238820 RepID=UPI00351BA60D